jgi:hypothetical protein
VWTGQGPSVTGETEVRRLVGYHAAAFDRYCANVFAPLRRADQRRVAREYLAGLVLLAGRRSARRIATATDRGLSDAAVQQFVNHSPWPSGPVRERVHARLSELLAPTAWVIDEVAFAKSGRYSAGVAVQHSGWAGARANCQLGVCLSLLGDTAAAPVSWRLALPRCWDHDQERRVRARVPDGVVARLHWQHVVELVDDLQLHWQAAVAPVLVDQRGRPGTDLLIDALDARGLDYAIRVDPDLEVLAVRQTGAGLRALSERRDRLAETGPTGPTGPTGTPGSRTRRLALGSAAGFTASTLTELARPAAARRRSTVIWSEGPEQQPRRSQFVSMPVELVGAGDGVVSLSALDRPLILVADWPAGCAEPRDAWLTTLAHYRVGEVVGLTRSVWRSRVALEEGGRRFGLFDHEGRSFAGWHHHVTLVGAGYGYALEHSRVEPLRQPGRGLPQPDGRAGRLPPDRGPLTASPAGPGRAPAVSSL